MINFSKISAKSLSGGLLRKLLGLIPNDTVLLILQGPMRGRKWIKGSGVSGYWLGTYELEHQQILSGLLRGGDVFYDVGAHVGFFLSWLLIWSVSAELCMLLSRSQGMRRS